METPHSSNNFQMFEGGTLLFIYRLNFPLQLILIIYTRGQTFNTLFVPSCKNNSGKRTFYYRVSKLWNHLSNDIRYNYESMSILSFKEILTAL